MSCSPVCLFHQDQQVLRKSHSVVAKLFSARAAPGPRSPRTSASFWRLRHFVRTKALEFLDVVRLRALRTGIENWSSPSQSASYPYRGHRRRTPAVGTLERLAPRASRPPRERPLTPGVQHFCVFGSLAPGKPTADTWRNRRGAASRSGCVQTGGQGAPLLRRFEALTPSLRSCSLPSSCSKGRRRRPPRRAKQTPPPSPLPCPPPPLRHAEMGEESVFCNLCSLTNLKKFKNRMAAALTLLPHPSSSVRKCKNAEACGGSLRKPVSQGSDIFLLALKTVVKPHSSSGLIVLAILMSRAGMSWALKDHLVDIDGKLL